MNGGSDAVLRDLFGTTLEYRVRMSVNETPLSVGQSRTLQTTHNKIKWLIVAPTVSISADGLSGHARVASMNQQNVCIRIGLYCGKNLHGGVK